MKFSFVIPTIKTVRLVELCLFTLWRTHGEEIETIVVDDGSSDEIRLQLKKTCEKYNAKLLLNKVNSGFAYTVNRGIKAATGDIIVLTNNDIIFTNNVTDEIEKAFSLDPKIGVVGGLLTYQDGSIQHAGVERLSAKRWSHRAWHRSIEYSVEAHISDYIISVTGALYAIKRDVINKVGYFNQNYFLAFEDSEYSLRVWQSGYRVFYSHNVRAIHAEGATRGANVTEKRGKGAEWFEKEIKTQRIFERDLKKFDVDGFEDNIKSLNSGKEIKIIEFFNSVGGSICLKRTGAMGDVLLLSGIIKYIKKEYPFIDINILTNYKEVFKNNHYVNYSTSDFNSVRSDYIIDLDYSYEKNPKQHIIKSYLDTIFGPKHNININDCFPIMFSNNNLDDLYLKVNPDVFARKTIVCHMSNSWDSRRLPVSTWEKVFSYFSPEYNIICVGAKSDDRPRISANVYDLVGLTRLYELKEIIKKSSCFVSTDSGLFHIASTTKTPLVGIFTCANPLYRVTRTENTKIITPDIDCKFCLHEYKQPQTKMECKFFSNECTKSINADEIIKEIKGVLRG